MKGIDPVIYHVVANALTKDRINPVIYIGSPRQYYIKTDPKIIYSGAAK